jgi:hypothetical protein
MARSLPSPVRLMVPGPVPAAAGHGERAEHGELRRVLAEVERALVGDAAQHRPRERVGAELHAEPGIADHPVGDPAGQQDFPDRGADADREGAAAEVHRPRQVDQAAGAGGDRLELGQ